MAKTPQVDTKELVELLTKHNYNRRGPDCIIHTLQTSTEQWGPKVAWIVDHHGQHNVTLRAAAMAIAELTGRQFAPQTLARHLRGECRCER